MTEPLRAVFTVTVETKPGGDYYFDHNDFVRHVVPWIEGGLDDRDDIRDVTIAEQPAGPAPATDRAAGPGCVCGEPSTLGTVHRTDGPCHVDDRADLRDRIAAALIRWTYRGQDPDPETGILDTVRANAYSRADAVLPVLPACSDPIECEHEAALGEAQQQVRRLGLMVDEYGDGASALTGKLKRIRDMHRETCPVAQGVILPPAASCSLCEVLDAPAAPVLPASLDRAAVLREAADRYTKLADQNEAYDREQGELDEAARLQHETVRDVATGLRRMADEPPQPTSPVRACRYCPDPACPQDCPACGAPIHDLNTVPARPKKPPMDPVHILGIKADSEQPEAFTPPVHYERDDGVLCCVHAIPVGPDSCRACRELADGEQAAAGPTAVDEVVAALQAKAQALSVEAEEEMRRDLEEQAQVWHEAAELARRTGRKTQRRTKPQPAAPAQPDGEA